MWKGTLKACGAALFFLQVGVILTCPLPARAMSFGISPPWVKAFHLMPGSEFRGTITLTRDDASTDQPVTVKMTVPDTIRSWIAVSPGFNVVIPQGVRQYPVTFVIDVPEDAEVGSYSGSVDFSACSPSTSGGVGICIGAYAPIYVTVSTEVYHGLSNWGFGPEEFGCRHGLWLKTENFGNVPDGPDRAAVDSQSDLSDLPPLPPLSSVRYWLPLQNSGFWHLLLYKSGQLIWQSGLWLTSWPPESCTQSPGAVLSRQPDLSAENSPKGITAADFNLDGLTDLAVANSGSDSVSILMRNHEMSFDPPVNYPAGKSPQALAAADLNQDGAPDIVVANRGNYDDACGCYPDGSVSVLLNLGDGRFGAPIVTQVGSDPQSIAVADFNGDGKLDLAVANKGSSNVSILLGDGDGSFTAGSNYSVPTWPVALTASDLNGNGKPDLAVVSKVSGLSTLIGVGDGTFATGNPYPLGGEPDSVLADDFNGDGTVDLAVGNRINSGVEILLGTGGGMFAPAVNYLASNFPVSVAEGDFNRDGFTDIAAGGATGHLTILHGDGQGGFGMVEDYSTSAPSPLAVLAGDLDGDGRPDIAGANVSSGQVSVWQSSENQTITFPLSISKVYGDPPFTVSATGGLSGNPVTFTAGPASVCSSSGPNGSTITILGAGVCTVTAHQAGNDYYDPAPEVSQSFTVDKATPTVNWSNPSAIIYGTALDTSQLNATFTWVVNGVTVAVDGTATYSPPAGSVPGPGSGQTLSVTFTPNDTRDYTNASKTVEIDVLYAGLGTLCAGAPGHQILQPIDAAGTSVFNQGRTVPARFRVCDAAGNSVGTAGVVADFRLVQITSGVVTDVNETVTSGTPDATFRWDSTSQQWIFNMSTTGLASNTTYFFRITLNDGTSIPFSFGLK